MTVASGAAVENVETQETAASTPPPQNNLQEQQQRKRDNGGGTANQKRGKSEAKKRVQFLMDEQELEEEIKIQEIKIPEPKQNKQNHQQHHQLQQQHKTSYQEYSLKKRELEMQVIRLHCKVDAAIKQNSLMKVMMK